jgi:hypothetical protein
MAAYAIALKLLTRQRDQKTQKVLQDRIFPAIMRAIFKTGNKRGQYTQFIHSDDTAWLGHGTGVTSDCPARVA